MSDGPIALTQRWFCNSNASATTAAATASTAPATSTSTTTTSTDSCPYFWLKAGATGLAFGLLAHHLLGYGQALWQDVSWVLLVFLLLYTLCLLLAVSCLRNQNGAPGERFSDYTPHHPRGLTRLRSYLAFFPITHVIHHHAAQHSASLGGGSGGDRETSLDASRRTRGETSSGGGGGGISTAGSSIEGIAHLNLPSDSDDQGLAFRINAQMELTIDAIVAEYVCPWHTKISDDSSFLEQCKAIIHAVFLQLGEKLRQVDRNEFAKEAIQIIHVHWREYTEALHKSHQSVGGDQELAKHFKFVHPFLQDTKEVSRHYQNLVSRVLEELHVPDLNSPVMCQFLAGIIVKNFVLYYAEMLCQPSWINGSLMTLLSNGCMSVDITGSSSQNSSSPASPLPEPSPKALSMFPDEALECASICASTSTAESTPTKKSRSSSGRSVSCQEDLSSKGELVQPDSKHFFGENVSSSVDEPSSASEPKTDSSLDTGSKPSPTDKQFPSKSSEGSSTASSSGVGMLSHHTFGSDTILMLTRRPKELLPLKTSASPLRTLSTALGSVMQATAFPLLPSECYNNEENNLPFAKYCPTTFQQLTSIKPLSKGQHVLEEISESDSQPESLLVDVHTNESSDSELKLSSNDSGTQEIQTELEVMSTPGVEDDDEEEVESTSESKGISPGAASHYYSFDEASRPKSASTSFFETSTLSLDGALDKSKRQASQDQLQLCSHEFKSELNADGKPNRSPVYEEPEDFAASIAKLRSLLEQKGRKSSTPPPCSAPPTMGDDGGEVFESPASSPPSTGTSSSEKPMMYSGGEGGIPQISETCASESHTTPSSTSSMDNSKASSRFSFNEPILIPSETDSTILDSIERTNYQPVPEITCCFRNVTIPKVENSADAGGQYMFYCIQYEGVYYDDEVEGGQPHKLVYRTTTIKRKFKEFLTLQAHLEENPACKPHLKGIKTPTRWTNVSLTKSDATVANQRRAVLEKYLQQLCYHPVIGFCQEVMVFMAYGEDGFCSFEVGDPKDLLTHRLDKLARKFTGVINSLKDALPSFELDLSPAPNTPKSEGITPCDLKSESAFPPFPFQEKYSALPHHDKEINLEPPPWTDKFVEGWNSDAPDSQKKGDDEKNDDNISTESAPFHEPEIEVEEGKIFSAYPLAAAVTQLLCDVLWLPQYRPHPASVATFMSISGKSLENYVVETMDIFLSEEAILGYLEWLTISIHQSSQLDTDSRYELNGDFFSEQDLKNIVKRRIPAWVRWMWGRNRLELTIDRITGLFQAPLVNHDLALSLCELLFSKMVPVDDANSAAD